MTDTPEANASRSRNAEYIATLRPLLPTNALQPYAPAYLMIVLHTAIVIAGWIAARYLVTRVWWPVVGLGVAFSLSSLAFLAHDLTHRSIVRKPWLLYPTELALWSAMFVPPTLYRRVHLAHHAHTNGDLDPDRRFLADEIGPGSQLAAAMLFPNQESRLSFLCRFYWAFFPVRNLIVLLYPGQSKPAMATAKVPFSRREKWLVAFEVAVIAALHIGLMFALRQAYAWTVLLPGAITSLVTTWYLFTNHGLHDIGDGSDVLGATTSVVVPKFCDVLHSNFSYHAEHHLFPTINPHYYPLVREMFQKHYPAEYHRLSMREAWRRLHQNKIIAVRRSVARATGQSVPQTDPLP